MRLRSLAEWVPLFWSTLVGSQVPLPLTFAIIIIFISVTDMMDPLRTKSYEKLWPTPTTVAVLLSAL